MKPMQDILQDLVAFHTVDGDKAANAAAISYIDTFLRERGMKPRIIEKGGYQNLFASTTDSKTPKVLLAAHVDVVPGAPELFSIREDEDKLYGRGVFDMKFSIAAFLSAIDALKDELHQYDFGIMITPDEEVGSPNGVPALIKDGYMPTGVCVLPDGADGQDWNIETFAKGAWFAEFKATGKRAHGSRPWNGDNAIAKLLRFIHEVQALFPPVSTEVSTMNIGQIQGGEAVNQVPDHASVRIDMRFPSIAEKERLRVEVDRLCDSYGITFSDIMFVSPTINDFDNQYLQAFAASVKAITGVQSKPSNTPAGTDARFFAEHNLPVIICVPPGGAHHSNDEWISRKGFGQFKDVIVDFLRTTARHT